MGSVDGSPASYKLLVELPNVVDRGHGLRTRASQVPPTTVRYLRVGDGNGDNFFSVSEFAAYCKAPTPFPPGMKIVDVPPTAAPDSQATPKPGSDTGRWALLLTRGRAGPRLAGVQDDHAPVKTRRGPTSRRARPAPPADKPAEPPAGDKPPGDARQARAARRSGARVAGDDDGAGWARARASLTAHRRPVRARGSGRRRDTGSARFVVLRLLGLVYLMAFLTLVNQGRGLIGAHGLLPAADFLGEVAAQLGGRAAGFWEMPTLFWLGAGDGAIAAVGWVGVALSLLVLAGYANAIVLAVLCALHISVVAIGQDFYAFGWELQLVETGFLCIFLCPLLDGRPFPRRPRRRRSSGCCAG